MEEVCAGPGMRGNPGRDYIRNDGVIKVNGMLDRMAENRRLKIFIGGYTLGLLGSYLISSVSILLALGSTRGPLASSWLFAGAFTTQASC